MILGKPGRSACGVNRITSYNVCYTKLLRVRADLGINLEHSANTIASVVVGMIRGKIKTKSPDLFFRYSAQAKARYFNPIEQQGEISYNFV